MIDVEQMLSRFLREQTEISDVVGDRVYTDLPHGRTYPLVLVQRTGGGFLINRPQWLEDCQVTIDVYGQTHKQAQSLASNILATMGSRLRGSYPEGCVTAVRGTEMAYNPEPESLDDSGHGRARFTVQASVLAHPN